MIRNLDIGDALSALRPNCEYMLEGENYSGITWLDKNQTLPTEQEVLEKLEELKKERPFVLLRKERNRLISYPSSYFHSKYPNVSWKEGRKVYVMFYKFN